MQNETSMLHGNTKDNENQGRALLCFAFLILYFTFFNAPAFASNLTGKVEIEGSYDTHHGGKTLEDRIKAERSLVVSKDGGIKNAVIFINGIKGNHSSAGALVMNQKNKTFTPHVLPIPVGSTVRFKNSDPFVHRIISNSAAKRLRMEFAYEEAFMDVTFDKPGIVELWCDDHKRMQSWILVMETPLVAVTDEKGHFAISNLPPGRYTAVVWHEGLGTASKEIEVEKGADVIIDFKLPGKEFY